MTLTREQIEELKFLGAKVSDLDSPYMEKKDDLELQALNKIVLRLDELLLKEQQKIVMPEINPIVNVPQPKVEVTVPKQDVIVNQPDPIKSWKVSNIQRDMRGLIKEVTITAN